MLVQEQEEVRAKKYTESEDATLKEGQLWDAYKVPTLELESCAGSG